MQEMNYDIEIGDLITPFDDAHIIASIIDAYLNADEELFNIAFKNNNEAFNKENLVFNEQVQGVLQLKTISLSNVNDGAENKEFLINLMLPLDENNKKYNDAVVKLIKNINNQQFDIADSISLNFKNVQMVDANKLSKPINGAEYELIIVSGTVHTTRQYLQATEQYIMVNGVKLGGVINISYTCLKTTDSDIYAFSSLIQKNSVNGIQIAIDVDLQVYKDDAVHMDLFRDAELRKDYKITYYNGLFRKEYNMILLQALLTGITGDSVKGKVSFVVGG